jgi:hypothetical protein
MLGVKQVTSNGAGGKVRYDQGQQERWPAKEPGNGYRQQNVHKERHQAVIVFPQPGEGGIQAHPIQKHEDIPKQNGQGMTHKQVLKAQGFRRLQVLRLGHDGIRANMRTSELRVVIVMVVVRAFPNTAGAQDQDSEEPHQPLRQTGMRQYRLVLLIVVNHKEPEIEQPGQQTAHQLAGEIEVPECARQGAREKKRSGKNVSPTPR